MQSEPQLHIASLVVMAPEPQMPVLCENIEQLPGSEIHAREGAKLVVTVEADSHKALIQRIDTLQALDSIVSSSLVYHHFQ